MYSRLDREIFPLYILAFAKTSRLIVSYEHKRKDCRKKLKHKSRDRWIQFRAIHVRGRWTTDTLFYYTIECFSNWKTTILLDRKSYESFLLLDILLSEILNEISPDSHMYPAFYININAEKSQHHFFKCTEMDDAHRD